MTKTKDTSTRSRKDTTKEEQPRQTTRSKKTKEEQPKNKVAKEEQPRQTTKSEDNGPLWSLPSEQVFRFPKLREQLVRNTEFRDQEGRTIAVVGEQGTRGFQLPMGHMYTMQLKDKEGNVLAEVYRNNLSGMGDNYTIEIRRSLASSQNCTFILRQSSLGGAYTLQDEDGQLLWAASDASIPLTLLCCAPCLMMGAFNFCITYYKKNQQQQGCLMMERNQAQGTIRMAAGTSPLLALCVAYATDRLLEC